MEDALGFLEGYDINYLAFDTRMMDRAVESLQAGELPDILTVYFAGADGVAHQQGIASQLDYLQNVIDPELGRIAGPSGNTELVQDGGMAYVYVTAGGDISRTASDLISDPALESAVDSILVRESPSSGYHLVQRGHDIQRVPKGSRPCCRACATAE